MGSMSGASNLPFLPRAGSDFLKRRAMELAGAALVLGAIAMLLALGSYDPADPSGALIDAFGERWFLPLLHMDIGPKFVQNIKLVEHLVRGTSPVTRAPRLPLVGAEDAHVRAVTAAGLKSRPDLSKYGF